MILSQFDRIDIDGSGELDGSDVVQLQRLMAGAAAQTGEVAAGAAGGAAGSMGGSNGGRAGERGSSDAAAAASARRRTLTTAGHARQSALALLLWPG